MAVCQQIMEECGSQALVIEHPVWWVTGVAMTILFLLIGNWFRKQVFGTKPHREYRIVKIEDIWYVQLSRWYGWRFARQYHRGLRTPACGLCSSTDIENLKREVIPEIEQERYCRELPLWDAIRNEMHGEKPPKAPITEIVYI